MHLLLHNMEKKGKHKCSYLTNWQEQELRQEQTPKVRERMCLCLPTQTVTGEILILYVCPWLHVFYLQALQAEERHQCVLWQNNKQ